MSSTLGDLRQIHDAYAQGEEIKFPPHNVTMNRLVVGRETKAKIKAVLDLHPNSNTLRKFKKLLKPGTLSNGALFVLRQILFFYEGFREDLIKDDTFKKVVQLFEDSEVQKRASDISIFLDFLRGDDTPRVSLTSVMDALE